MFEGATLRIKQMVTNISGVRTKPLSIDSAKQGIVGFGCKSLLFSLYFALVEMDGVSPPSSVSAAVISKANIL